MQFVVKLFIQARIGQRFIHRSRKPQSFFRKACVPSLLILFVSLIMTYHYALPCLYYVRATISGFHISMK